jgi:hypothetical protein
MQIRPVGAELLYVDGRTGRTDMRKLIVAFHSFADASKTRPYGRYTFRNFDRLYGVISEIPL